MMAAKLLLCVAFVTAVFLCVQGASVLEPPRNVTAVTEQNVTLVCRVEFESGDRDSLTWEKISPGSSGQIIYRSIDPPEKIHRPDKYAIEGTYNLVIKNTELADGGVYSCFFYLDSETKYSVNVIVLGQPTLQVANEVMQGEPTEISCQANVGALSLRSVDSALWPAITLTVGPTSVIAYNFSYTTIDENPDKVNVLYAHTSSAIFGGQHDGKEVKCAVKASFAPYVAAVASQTIQVVYPVRDVSFGITKNVYQVNDVITCKADGHPDPSYVWTNVNNPSQVVQGNKLTVTADMAGKRHSWNCTASNVITTSDQSTTYYAFRVFGPFSVATGLASSLHRIDVTVCSIAFLACMLMKNLF